ncbi:MAG: hypothetical protein K8R16_02405, partial [Anaerolineales bacterium]|nr:hypothetical protein [Anaerolineales bacterium]
MNNSFAHAPAAQWIEPFDFPCGDQDRRLTSNCARGLNTVYMGVISVHPLDGVDQELSIKSTKSILSMPIAPALHQNYTKNTSQINWFGGSINNKDPI